MYRKTHFRHAVSAFAVALAAACSTDTAPTSPGSSGSVGTPLYTAGGIPHAEQVAALDAVLAGNAEAVASAHFLVPPGAPLAPFVESRLYAIANVAMHDALNAVVPRFQRYADTGPINSGANLAAAVLTAAHDAIAGADPGRRPTLIRGTRPRSHHTRLHLATPTV
jgi:hypothetical protein